MARVIEVSGDEQVIRSLEAKGDRALDLTDVMDRVAGFAQRQIKPSWENRSGDLTASITGTRPQVFKTGFNVISDVDYARFVFRGTVNMDARPPRVNVEAIARRGATDINRAIERA